MSEQFSYVAAIHSFDYASKKGIFYLMNTSPNKNMWGVSTTALADGLPTVLNKPLGMGKNYRKGHFNPEDSMNSGIFTTHENKGNYALGTAEITDTTTLDKMRTGELNAVSVVITPHKIVCSKCGQQLPDNTRPGQLHCQNSPLTVESFVFDRVDFVDNPAYPQAGLLKIAASYLQSNTSTPLSLTAAVYECSQNQNNVKHLKSEKMMSEQKNETEKFEAQINGFSKTCADLSSRLAAAEAGLAVLKAENDKAKAELYAALIEKVFSARKTSGLTVLDDTVERNMLSNMPASTLELLLTEAEKKKTGMQAETTGASNPKFNKTTNTQNSLAAALKAQREELAIPVVEEEA